MNGTGILRANWFQVTMPDVIKKCNAIMGNTNRMDQSLANYRPTIRVKK